MLNALPQTVVQANYLHHPTLLIISCSQRKRSDPGLLPAIDRYDGLAFRLLRRFLTQHTEKNTQISVYILSAEFGLIPDNHLIPYYDRRMTKQRASQLQPEVLAKIQQLFDMRPDALAKSRCDPKLYICAGRDYLKALEGYKSLIPPGVNVQIAAGSLGKKLSTLHTWLYGKPPELDRHLTQTLSGQVNFKGLKLEMTPDRVLDIARQALAESKGHLD